MVELIDNHHVEVLRANILDAIGIQALNRGKDVLEAIWSRPADPFFPEGRVAQGMPKRALALVEDLLPVGHE